MSSLIRTTFFTCLSLIAIHSSLAQPMRAPEKEQPTEIINYEPESEEFKRAFSELREQIKAMHTAEIRYHTSDSAAEDSRLKREWYEAREPIHNLHINLLNAALAEYLSDPVSRADLGRIIFKSLKRNMEKDNFDGMLPIAKGLIDTNYPDPELQQIYFQCCLANNEYALAKQFIQIADLPPEQAEQATKQIDIFAKNWEEELEARKRDAAGEPLPQAKINTSKGEVIVELFENEAPEAVASFINLAEKGFYDYLDFFMVINHSVAQVGCPAEDGSGGPGYMLKDEFDKPGARKCFRGSLVLATLRGRADSGGSQFFITFLPTLEAAQNTVFGRVISGMQNIANLNRIDPQKTENEDKKEKEKPKLPPDEIISIEIIRKRNHPYEPNRLPLAPPASAAPAAESK